MTIEQFKTFITEANYKLYECYQGLNSEELIEYFSYEEYMELSEFLDSVDAKLDMVLKILASANKS